MSKTHSMSKTKLYDIWCAIKRRCYKEKDIAYKYYGAKGIKMCDEWENNFMSFYEWAINNGYKETQEGCRNNITIDRIDVKEGKKKKNCRWVDMYEQNLNKRNTLYVVYNGEKQPLKKVSKILNIPYMTLFSRIKELGWSEKEVLEIKPNTIRHTINKSKEKFIQFARGKYIVVIKRKHIKSFNNLEDAINCRNKKLRELGLYVENNIVKQQAKEMLESE